MKPISRIILLLFLMPLLSNAQFDGQKFGNEWINYSKNYYKIGVSENGWYSISVADLKSQGYNIEGKLGSRIAIFNYGNKVPIQVSSKGALTSTDVISFFGLKNTGKYEQNMFDDPDLEFVNPYYSLFSDDNYYFLTYDEAETNFVAEQDLSNSAAVLESYIKEEVVSYDLNFLNYGRNNIRNSDFTDVEGFSLIKNASFSETLEVSNSTTINNFEPSMEIRLAPYLNGNLNPYVVTIGGAEVYSEYIPPSKVSNFNLKLSQAQLAGNIKLGIETAQGRFGVGYIKYRYGRQLKFSNSNYEELVLPPSSNELQIVTDGFQTSGGVIAYLENGVLCKTTISGNTVRFTVPAHSKELKLYLAPANNSNTVKFVGSRKFINHNAKTYDYIILTHPALEANYEGKNQIQEYANFRSSADGGSYGVDVLYYSELADQFAYGFDLNPYSVRNFSNYLSSKEKLPESIFVIGKGISYDEVRNTMDKDYGINFFIPTYGYPGADNLLTAPYKQNYPEIQIGRLPATNAEEISVYLNKVKQRENFLSKELSQEENLWNKKFMFLSGGGNADQNLIKAYTDQTINAAKVQQLQPYIKPFFKRTNDNVTNVFDDEIYDEINEGTALVQFFGHSAPDEFDFNISDFSKYDNDLKWPVLLALGCYSGNIHRRNTGIAENFINEDPNGYISFLSSSGPGVVFSMSLWAQEFYKSLLNDPYATVGGSAKDADTRLAHRDIHLAQQFTLVGDPAIRLKKYKGSDYTIYENSVSVNPEFPTLQMDSLEFNYTLSNIGLRSPDSTCLVTIEHTLPNGTKNVIFDEKVTTLVQAEKVHLKIPIVNEMSGLNKISIVIDRNNEITEYPASYAESNNGIMSSDGSVTSFRFYVSNSGVVLNYPEDLSIQGSEVVLTAQPSNPFDSSSDYIIELDKSHLFNSENLKSYDLQSDGDLLMQNVTSELASDQVYYWRVKKVLPNNLFDVSATRSFIYRPGDKPGWNISDDYQKSLLNPNGDEIYYDTLFNVFEMYKNGNVIRENISKYVDETNGPRSFWNFREQRGRMLVIKNTATLSINIKNVKRSDYFNPAPQFSYEGAEKVTNLEVSFSTATAQDRSEIINFIKQLPTGSYYEIYTLYNDDNKETFKISEWDSDSNNLIDFLVSEGFESFASFKDGKLRPFFGMKRVGFDKFLIDQIGENENDNISSGEFILYQGDPSTAKFTTGLIGPASKWDKIDFSQISKYPFNNNSDEFQFSYDVLGVDASGNETPLFPGISDIEYNLASVDANAYPNIKLKVTFTSPEGLSPQFDFMRVYFEGLPDITFDSESDANTINDIGEAGGKNSVNLAVKNISPYDFGSTTFDVEVISSGVTNAQRGLTIPALAAGETKVLSFDVTLPIDPNNVSLVIKLNPEKIPYELNYENNVISKNFKIKSDIVPPNIEIYADGKVLVDRELISQNAMLQLFVSDKNTNLLSDPNYTRITLTYPNGQSRILNNEPNLSFSPATDKNNMSSYSYPLQLTESGNYQITVKAEDAAGNIASGSEINYSFQIETENMISEVYNYPNPFRDRTRFFYRLSGVAPDQFSIKIFTPNGRLVREISKEEIGELRVGANLSDYEWDGTDSFGNKLAPGVYLYKVDIRDTDGKQYEKNQMTTNTKFFNKGYGKMVIIN